jgi:hypothetical protein
MRISYKTLRRLIVVLAYVLACPGMLTAQQLLAAMPEIGRPDADPVEAPSVARARATSGGVEFASGPLAPGASAPMPAMAVVAVMPPPKATVEHRFWDRENRFLFAAAGAMAATDFCATHANLASGGKELNPMTRVFSGSTPALATNFALETGGVIGVSYLFHKSGHHKLERITSIVNIGASAAAAGYSFSHR